MKKIVVIGIIGIVLGMSLSSCIGTRGTEQIVNIADQRTRLSLWESLVSYGFQPVMHSFLRFVSPGINFPLPGEVYRVGDIVEINGTTSML